MAESLTDSTGRADAPTGVRGQSSSLRPMAYVFALTLATVGLLIWRTDLAQLVDDGPIFLLLLVFSLVCAEFTFPLSSDADADLSGLFSGAAVLTLGFNGVWVAVITNLYWLLRRPRPEVRSAPPLSRLVHGLMNLSLIVLPLLLGLLVYQQFGGQIPLANLGDNFVPVAAYVLMQWLALLAALFPILILTTRSLKGTVDWFRGILTGFALSFFLPALFAPAVAVILNRLSVGSFVFIAAGLLGISLMAQRLAHSLVSARRRVQELTSLNELSDDIIHNPLSVEATGELLLKHISPLLLDDEFQLALFDPQEPQQRQTLVDWRAGTTYPAANGPMSPPWTWLHDEHQLLHRDLSAQEPLPFTWDEQIDGPYPGSLLLVPLLVADPDNPEAERCIGGILIQHARQGSVTADVVPSISALAHQVAAALENARLQQEALARERLERELALARDIQISFLPADVPQVEGWSFIASLEPARHVSGDFYDFIPLPGERWGVLIADVADKGMPAALYMALARTLIRAHAPDHADDPAACLLAANDQILADTQSDLFVTVFYGILDPTQGEMTFANAGHNPPYLCRQGGRPAEALRNTGMALGVLPGFPLDNGHTALDKGDYLLLYTDGVTEALDLELNEFGNDRLLAGVMSTNGGTVESVHHRIRNAVDEFVGKAPQFDDLTLMVIGRENLKG